MVRRRRHREPALQLALSFVDADATPQEQAVVRALFPTAPVLAPAAMPTESVAPPPQVAPARSKASTRQGSRLTSADTRAMVWRRAQGESLSAIAAQFRISPHTVVRVTKNLDLIRQLEEQEERGRRVEALQRQGLSSTEIAHRLRLAHADVVALLHGRPPVSAPELL